jgi:hypothetical protein
LQLIAQAHFQPAHLPGGEHDLKERGASDVALRVKVLDQPFERQLLMGKSAEQAPAHPFQQLLKRNIRRYVRAHHQSVHEEPNQAFHLPALPVGDWNP